MEVKGNDLRRGVIVWPYFLLLIVGLTVPSDGQHGLLSIKSLSFLLALFTFAPFAFFQKKITYRQLCLVPFLFGFFFILFFWTSVSTLQGETTFVAQSDQFKLFVITLFFPVATLFLIEAKMIAIRQFYKTAIYASFFYMVAKIILVILHAFHFINIWSLLRLLGIRFMSMNIYGGIERMQTSVDIVTPFLLLFVLQSDKLGIPLKNGFKRFYIALSLVSTFLSFSRLLLGVYFLGFCLYWFSLGPRGIVKVVTMLVAFSFCIYLAVGPETVHHIIERRFFSADTTESDDTRVKQAEAMLVEFNQYPFLGKGLGGFASGYIRDPITLHYYEVQWLSFLMQFGILGILFLMIPLGIIALRMINAPFSRIRWSFLALFLIWLLAGFTNPFLISLASGIIYTLFFVVSDALP